MKKGWRIILVIVAVAILLGAVCVCVGLVTGGDWGRINSVLDGRFHYTAYKEAYWPYVQEVYKIVVEAWNG